METVGSAAIIAALQGWQQRQLVFVAPVYGVSRLLFLL
jgi:hypothetical protein